MKRKRGALEFKGRFATVYRLKVKGERLEA